ncbi:MAG TPA: hypothetical protein VF007_04275, partial [Stellaceae bacterium]
MPVRARTVTPGEPQLTRLRVAGMRLGLETRRALFPDFVVEPGRGGTADMSWARLGEGLLRAPPYAGRAAAGLSVVAMAVSGRPPADRLDPVRILADRGWETPELIERARAARHALLAARTGGMWWGDDTPIGDADALVALAEPPLPGSIAPAEDTLIAMLDAALAEHPPERLVVLAPNPARLPRLGAKLATAAAQGARVITR